jgi:hypothetical protein
MSDFYINKNNSFLKRIEFHYNTALLESLSWDSEAFNELLLFVDEWINKSGSNQSLEKLFSEVELKWSPDTREILENMFNSEKTYLNIDSRRSGNVEN